MIPTPATNPRPSPASRLDRLDQLEPGRLAALHGRSMLQTQDWTVAEIDALCRLAEALEALDRAGVRVPLFPDELHLALFFDSSTRTRSSWAGAASRLGARPLVVDGTATQVSHGETAEETGTMLGLAAHALGVRHDKVLGEGQRFLRQAKAGLDAYLAALGDGRVVPVVNLQCDVDHPTQTLADLLWLRERFPEGLAGRTIAVSWAYSPSYAKPLSVPQGLATLLTRFGMHVRLAHPEGYGLIPETMATAAANARAAGGSFTVIESADAAAMDRAFAGADVVYPKSWGPYELMLERVEASRAGDEVELGRIERAALERNRRHRDWICDENRMATTEGGDALYMHCLPADLDAEVSAGVMERHRFHLAREAHKKLYAIMALLAAAKEPAVAERLRGFAAAAANAAGGAGTAPTDGGGR